MHRWDGTSTLPKGTILTSNLLWRMGMHELWDFFQVSHVTDKGSVMGFPLARIKTNTRWDEQQNHLGTVKPDTLLGEKRRAKRLVRSRLYYILSEHDVQMGIPEFSCAR